MLYTVFTPPRFGWITRFAMSLMWVISLAPVAALAQIQNPYWVLPTGPSPFQAVRNAPSSGPTVYSLPGNFSIFPDRLASTAANGWFNSCGNPIFFQVGDELFDNLGVIRSVFTQKDHWIKTLNTSLGGNPDPDPFTTENFELPIVPVPGSNNQEFFIFFTNSSPSGTALSIVRYNTIDKTTAIANPINLFSFNSARLAVSKPDQTGKRDLFVLGNTGTNNLKKITIPANGANPSNQNVSNIGTVPGVFPGGFTPELELSHDGTRLAWSSGTTISVYNLTATSNNLLSFTPFPGAFSLVSGLEWLPNGDLAAAIDWSSNFNFADGICVINAAFNNFSFASGTSDFRKSALEFGYLDSGTPRIFAFNGTSLTSFNANTLVAVGTPLATTKATLTSYFGLGSFPVLPDQVDGGFYTGTNCGGPPTESLPRDVSLDAPIPGTTSPLKN